MWAAWHQLIVPMPYLQNQLINGQVAAGAVPFRRSGTAQRDSQISGTACRFSNQMYHALQVTLHRRFSHRT